MSNFDVVAIGTSGGGLEALTEVLSHLPADLPASILIVMHLYPRNKSIIAELLKRRCQIRIKDAVNDEPIEKSVIYIATPDKHLLLIDGKTYLTSTALVHFNRPSIDHMFESVAVSMDSKVIGVILTGGYGWGNGYQDNKGAWRNDDSAGPGDRGVSLYAPVRYCHRHGRYHSAP
jgi:two-component system chemotaxis response regulator CheB